MSIGIYCGKESGYEGKDALMECLKTIDDRVYTVLTTQFYNRPNDPQSGTDLERAITGFTPVNCNGYPIFLFREKRGHPPPVN